MWLYYGLLSAFFNAIANIARRTHGSLAQPAELSWWALLFGLPPSIGLLMVSNTPAYTSYGFVVPALIGGLLNTFASVYQYRAYKLADASLVSPIANFLPLLMVGTSFLMLGVLPGWGAFAGIILVVCGVYYSSVSGKHALTHPLKQMFRNRGSRAMLITVVIWSITANLDRIALRSASPSFLQLLGGVIIFTLLSLYLLSQPQHKRFLRGEKVLRKWGWHIAAISLFAMLAVFFQLHAVALVSNPSYVLAVKRLDVLMTILFAGLFLREKHILKRFKGAVIAAIGVALIVIFS